MPKIDWTLPVGNAMIRVKALHLRESRMRSEWVEKWGGITVIAPQGCTSCRFTPDRAHLPRQDPRRIRVMEGGGDL